MLLSMFDFASLSFSFRSHFVFSVFIGCFFFRLFSFSLSFAFPLSLSDFLTLYLSFRALFSFTDPAPARIPVLTFGCSLFLFLLI